MMNAAQILQVCAALVGFGSPRWVNFVDVRACRARKPAVEVWDPHAHKPFGFGRSFFHLSFKSYWLRGVTLARNWPGFSLSLCYSSVVVLHRGLLVATDFSGFVVVASAGIDSNPQNPSMRATTPLVTALIVWLAVMARTLACCAYHQTFFNKLFGRCRHRASF